MEYTKKQINTLAKLLRNHIHGSKEEKILIEKSMKKYGCSGPGDVYKILKNIRKQDKEEIRDLA